VKFGRQTSLFDGCGNSINILENIALGVDMFDCVCLLVMPETDAIYG
jgi:queuine/archaeosine tRNA-ribosyltransferase